MLYSLGVIIMRVKYLRIILLWVVLLPFVMNAQPVSVSLDIPEYVVFAGDTLDIRRYDLRERYDREQLSFMYMHSSSLQIVRRANRYFPIIEPILKREGVPDDFKYLAVIESSLNPLAYSPAKAAGMWQFLGSTGKEYGLEVSEEVDERYHVEKATVAACRYLKDARERLGSWVNAAAAYNAGLNRISGEQEKQRVESALDMRLVSETSRYVFRIMAAKAFLEAPQKFGFYLKKEHFYHHIRVKEVEVSGVVEDWAVWCERYGLTYAQLKDFNPWLRGRGLKNERGRRYVLLLPLAEDLYYSPEKVQIHYAGWVGE